MAVFSKEKVIASQTIIRKLPANFAEDDRHLFVNDLSKKLPDVFIYRLEDINISPAGILFKGLRVFKQFLIWPKHADEFNIFYLVRNYIKRKRQVVTEASTLVVCFDYWSSGYFHWICDFLPRLLLVEDQLKNSVLLLPQNHSAPFVEASLKAFGVNKILRFSDQTYLSCKQVIVPGYVTNSGDNRPEVMLKIRAKLLGFYGPEKNQKKYSENIYVSRSKSQGRFVTNENEVIEVLKEHGFEVIYFEDHSFEEQIAICYHAKNLIGIHGANLTNILFMGANTNVLELRRIDDDFNNYYFSLASSCNINYHYLKCETKNVKSLQSFDLHVDTSELTKCLLTLLKNI